MNGVYKQILMDDIRQCSNLPYIEDEWDEVLEGTYNFNMCKLSFNKWPETILPGYWKIVVETFDGNDDRVSSLTVILQIELVN